MLDSKIEFIDPKLFINNFAVCFPTYLIPIAERILTGSALIDSSIAFSKLFVFLSYHCGKEISSS